MSELTEKVKSRGHWDVTVRPAAFDPERLPYAKLDEVIEGAVVRLRGWPVPFIDARKQHKREQDWIGQDNSAEVVDHYEAWRFFMSGQFNHLRAVSADWRTGKEATRAPQGFDSAIEVWEILFYLTEVFELATRLALSEAGDESMTLEIALRNLGKRALVVGQRNRAEFIEPYPAPLNDLTRTLTTAREKLVAESRNLAVEVSHDFFVRFGWKPPLEQLREHQQELLSYR